jgi:hypothetical protein
VRDAQRNGIAAAQLTLFQLEQYLKQDGREVRFFIRRGAEQKDVRVTLRRVV